MEEKNQMEKGNYIIMTDDNEIMGLESVYESYNKLTNKKYLCRLLNLKILKNKQISLEDIIETINLHSQLKNDNIDNLIEYLSGKSNLYLFFDYIEGTTLYNYKKEGKNYKEKEIYLIINQVMDAILYLYNSKIILNDLKLENLFITDEGKIFLCNLERKVLLSRSNKGSKIKNSYIKITSRIGAIICKLLDYENFTNYTKTKKIRNLNEKDIYLIQEYLHTYILTNEKISKQLKNLICSLLAEENNRINIEDIKSHKWFQLFSENKVYKSHAQFKKKDYELKSSTDVSNMSNASTIRENTNKNIMHGKIKNAKEETIITDEPYFEYYKKEREVLLGLIDSFDKDEIYNNLKLAEKYEEEKAKSKNEKKSNLVNYDNNTNYDESENEMVRINKKKKEKKGFLSIFSCH